MHRLSSFSLVPTRWITALACGLLLCCLFFISFAPGTRAANGINRQINYQAKLSDSSGTAVADGTYALKISLYDSSTGGTRLWTATGTTGVPTAMNVTTVDGMFTLALGDTSDAGGNQNALDSSIDWNSDSLYLGITVAADAEMTPRRHLTAVAQAFNSMQLQGMSASGTVYGGSDLFTLFQTTNDAATGTRSALTIRSNGTSNSSDYLLRGINNLGNVVLTVNRQGSVTSSGSIALQGSTTSTFAGGVSTTQLSVDQGLNALGNVTLGDSSGDSLVINGGVASDILPSGAARNFGSQASPWFSGHFLNVSTTAATATTLYATSVTTTYFDVLGSGTSTFVGGVSTTRLSVDQGLNAQGNVTLGNSSGDSLVINSGVASDILPSGVARSFGAEATPWYYGYFSNVSTTAATATTLYATSVTTTYFDVIGTGTSTFAGSLDIAGNVSSTNGRFSNWLHVNGDTTLGDILSDTVTFNAHIGSSFVPNLADTYDLGSNAFKWSTVYGGTGSFSTSTATYLTATYATTTNSTSTNLFATAATFTGVTTTNLYATNFSSGAFSAADLLWTNATGTNTTSTQLGVTRGIRNVFSSNSSPQLITTVSSNTPTPYFLATQGRYLYTADRGGGTFRVFDVNDPANPTFVGSVSSLGQPSAIAVSGKYAYVTNYVGSLLYVIDISIPAQPVKLSQISVTNPFGLTVAGSFAYVPEFGGGAVSIVDISNPSSPSLVSRITGFTNPWDVKVQGNYLYVSDSTASNLKKYNISNPASPSLAGTYTFVDAIAPVQMAIQGNYLYVPGNAFAELVILDISGSGAPSLVNTVSLGATVAENGIAVQGRYVYIASANKQLKLVDVQNPASASVLSSTSIAGAFQVEGIAVSGKYVYIGDYLSSKIYIYDTEGLETSALMAHSADIGSLSVRSDGSIFGSLQVQNGLSVGQPGIHSDGVVSASASSTSSTARFINSGSTNYGNNWGAYVNRLAVGNDINVTGTAGFMQVVSYNSNTGNGLCLNDTKFASTCATAAGASIQAEGTINGSAFDLAERYHLTDVATSSDVLVFDASATTSVKLSPGVPYDPHIVGVYSTDPGFLLGFGDGIPVALSGRVPTKVSTINGSIAVGDLLTTSPFPGVAMKATKPGMTLGYALEPASSTSTIEVFVKTGYSALGLLNTDGSIAQMTDDLVVAPTSTATALQPTVGSWGLTFRGSAWDGGRAVTSDFKLVNAVSSVTSSAFTIMNASSTSLFSLDQQGSVRLAGDLVLSGKIYPGSRTGAQTSTYLFLDTVEGTTSTYIATNADGWQANDSYDFAERYYSPDQLEPGDLVVASQNGRAHVQRAWSERQLLLGIVSTRPGFVTGRPASSTYPIALAGRVPTKVSTIKGAIHAGDPLTASTMPGVAVKATEAGPIVGQALEDYDNATIGTIEVYVNPSWWGGDAAPLPTVVSSTTVIMMAAPTSTSSFPQMHKGLALMLSGAKRVHVAFSSLGGYPNIQVTPYAEVEGGWWIQGVTDQGFDVIFRQDQARDVAFSWTASGFGADERVYQSDGTSAQVDPTTGIILPETRVTSTVEFVSPPMPEPVTELSTTHATTEPSLPVTATTTEDVMSVPEAVPAPAEGVTSTVSAEATSSAPVLETSLIDAESVTTSSSTNS